MRRPSWKTVGLLVAAVGLLVVFTFAWSDLSRPLHPHVVSVDLSSGDPASYTPAQITDAQLQAMHRTTQAELFLCAASLIGLIVIGCVLIGRWLKHMKARAEPDLSDVF